MILSITLKLFEFVNDFKYKVEAIWTPRLCITKCIASWIG